MKEPLGRSKGWGRGYTTIPIVIRRILELGSGNELEWYLLGVGLVAIRKRSSKEDEMG